MFVLGIAVSVSAGEVTCPVAGIEDYVVVTVKNPVAKVYSLNVTPNLKISEPQTKAVNVAVEILSLDLKTVYATDIVSIKSGCVSSPSNSFIYTGLPDGTPVAIRIASASCKPY